MNEYVLVFEYFRAFNSIFSTTMRPWGKLFITVVAILLKI